MMDLTDSLQKNVPLKVKVGLLYFLLLCGGLWHVLGILQTTMRILSSFLLVFLAVLIFFETWINFESSLIKSNIRTRFLFWAVAVISLSIFIEWLGVETAYIFGRYQYGEVLYPFIGTVPLAIGFAWFSMALSSVSISQRLLSKINVNKTIVLVIFGAFFMTLFDFFMEPAAVKLQYWSWDSEQIPVQNYLAWFLIGFFFIWIGSQLKLFEKKLPIILVHVYFAQLCYFILVYFS